PAVAVVYFMFACEKVPTLDITALEIWNSAVESIDPCADVLTNHAKRTVNERGFNPDNVLDCGRNVTRIGIDWIQNARWAAANIAAHAQPHDILVGSTSAASHAEMQKVTSVGGLIVDRQPSHSTCHRVVVTQAEAEVVAVAAEEANSPGIA